jgi:hypothetical protein
LLLGPLLLFSQYWRPPSCLFGALIALSLGGLGV